MLPTIINAVDFEYECWEGENCACRHRLSDGSGGSSDVFFEQRSLPGAQHRHGDDCRGIRRRDGNAGAQTEIRIRCAENHRQDQTQKNGPEGQLLHFHGFRDVGAMFADASGDIPRGSAHRFLVVIRISLPIQSSSDGAP